MMEEDGEPSSCLHLPCPFVAVVGDVEGILSCGEQGGSLGDLSGWPAGMGGEGRS